ncbi:hypothetical protein RclHR1_04770001 [Rhizophagus clarus]|uniref:DUF659 domain-containing protein n=1 Tax=Rhizophagus clarus TaxID=94130 RepID=A0A2Z6RP59_9GLOM|nr:hypothetical protein RclHR1_04770001 [Rhizophagus clarus]
MSGLCNGKRLDWAEAEARKINISNTVPMLELDEDDDNLSQASFSTINCINFHKWYIKTIEKQLRRIHNDIVFLPCFAHQTNLCVADVLKSSQRLLETSKNATAIVKHFNASSKFTKDLHNEQKRIYNKYITLIQHGQTR